jgi:hypothetical protein
MGVRRAEIKSKEVNSGNIRKGIKKETRCSERRAVFVSVFWGYLVD